jgi:small subunit ribosomal protein S1
VEARYHVGQVIEGTVTNVVSFGAFVRVEEGLEGLIHVSELAEGSFLHPRNVVREGDEVSVRVLNVDTANRRLGLSLRQVHDDSLAG